MVAIPTDEEKSSVVESPTMENTGVESPDIDKSVDSEAGAQSENVEFVVPALKVPKAKALAKTPAKLVLKSKKVLQKVAIAILKVKWPKEVREDSQKKIVTRDKFTQTIESTMVCPPKASSIIVPIRSYTSVQGDSSKIGSPVALIASRPTSQEVPTVKIKKEPVSPATPVRDEIDYSVQSTKGIKRNNSPENSVGQPAKKICVGINTSAIKKEDPQSSSKKKRNRGNKRDKQQYTPKPQNTYQHPTQKNPTRNNYDSFSKPSANYNNTCSTSNSYGQTGFNYNSNQTNYSQNYNNNNPWPSMNYGVNPFSYNQNSNTNQRNGYSNAPQYTNQIKQERVHETYYQTYNRTYDYKNDEPSPWNRENDQRWIARNVFHFHGNDTNRSSNYRGRYF